ncbi:MAG: transglutaminase family protein [Thermodesulfobacteriota bacterium]|nr:transglutaminase family protein [Thermodesulfobacteriota bacterium]
MNEMEECLKPTFTIDCENPGIIDRADRITYKCTDDRQKAIELFYFVRDSIAYSLYMISVFKEDFIASKVLEWGKGYCVQKAVLLAALGRAAKIPSRLVFARIRNHRVPHKIVQMTGTNVFPRHGYTQFFLDGRWVSAAPTFDKALCEKNGLPVVEFNAKDDAMLPDKDLQGRPYIEYIEKFRPYPDLPFEWIAEKISKILGKDKRPWLSKEDMPQP